MEKKLLPYLVIISAISVSLSAAFYSVTGLSKMFSGASIEVMIMMGSLEIAKLVLASLLYQYWSKFNNALKTYYFIALFVLMSITSAGIYGYLSSAYSETSMKIENIDKKVKVLDTKREMYQVQLNDVRSEKERISSNISNLTNALSNNVIQTRDRNGQIITTTSSANRKAYESQLKISQNRIQEIQIKEVALVDSISTMNFKKLELETNTDIAGEIGPLKYISKLTGSTIDQVVNWFIIALMLVFDPLAVSLVVGANVIFRDKKREKEKIQKSIEIDNKIKEFEQRESQFLTSLKNFEEKEEDINNKEEQFNKSILEREQEIENKEKEYLKKLHDLDQDLYNFKKFTEKEKQDLEEKEFKVKESLKESKDKIKSDERESKEKYQNQLNQLKKEKDEFEEEKKKLFKLKKEIEEDKKDVELKFDKISELEDDLRGREMKLDEVKEDLNRLDSEIKSWESSNWKMRRLRGDKPPSAL
jgi:chromosome segregation ATPase